MRQDQAAELLRRWEAEDGSDRQLLSAARGELFDLLGDLVADDVNAQPVRSADGTPPSLLIVGDAAVLDVELRGTVKEPVIEVDLLPLPNTTFGIQMAVIDELEPEPPAPGAERRRRRRWKARFEGKPYDTEQTYLVRAELDAREAAKRDFVLNIARLAGWPLPPAGGTPNAEEPGGS
ncbi:MAG TPA: hypothetical protein VNV44_11680 [Solirubrobacteraceae bacterium]|nr:hypothetical protein [Solirubrobacteraceae bacterium]